MTATLGDLQAKARAQLRSAGVPSAALDADLLLCAAAGITRERLIGYPETAASDDVADRLSSFLARRAGHEPVSRILAMREFWGLDFTVTPDVLDPRADSETLIEVALAVLKGVTAPRILDLGTGSGCLLLSLLHECADATGVGVDLSSAAVDVAQRNAGALDLSGRAAFMVGAWGSSLPAGSFDLVVSNPPYIETAVIPALAPEVANHDPHLALDGGADGLTAYRQIVPDLTRLLRPAGTAVLEVGQGQSPDVSRLLETAGATCVEVRRDLAGIDRCVCASFAENRHKS